MQHFVLKKKQTVIIQENVWKDNVRVVEYTNLTLWKKMSALKPQQLNWQKFEYVTAGQMQEGKEKKKLQLVRKETCPGAMFENFKLLHEFSSHQFRASWQSKLIFAVNHTAI